MAVAQLPLRQMASAQLVPVAGQSAAAFTHGTELAPASEAPALPESELPTPAALEPPELELWPAAPEPPLAPES